MREERRGLRQRKKKHLCDPMTPPGYYPFSADSFEVNEAVAASLNKTEVEIYFLSTKLLKCIFLFRDLVINLRLVSSAIFTFVSKNVINLSGCKFLIASLYF